MHIKKLNEWLSSYFDIDDGLDFEDNEDEEDDYLDTPIFCIELTKILYTGKAEIFEVSIEERNGYQGRIDLYGFKKYEKNGQQHKYSMGLNTYYIKQLINNNIPIISGWNIPRNIFFNSKCKKSDINKLLREQITSMKRSFAGKLRTRTRKFELLQREITQLQNSRTYIDDLNLDKILKNLKQ